MGPVTAVAGRANSSQELFSGGGHEYSEYSSAQCK
jgi:hypothetical protein